MSAPDPNPSAWASAVSAILSSEVGTAASVISLALTLWILKGIHTLRSHFLFTARLPQLLSDLRENTSALSKGLAEDEEWVELVDIELAKCRANLMSIASKVKGDTKKGVNAIRISIDEYLVKDRSKIAARSIYTRLNGLTQELHNLHEDTKWSE